MSNDLRDELAAWHSVARENICVGNGGDELLYNYLLAFGGAGRTLLNCPPCFSEYAFFASLCQTEVRDVWRDPATFELDQSRCARGGTRVQPGDRHLAQQSHVRRGSARFCRGAVRRVPAW